MLGRSLRGLCRIYNNNPIITYSTLRKPLKKCNFLATIQKQQFSTLGNSRKITGSLIDIQTSKSSDSPLAQNIIAEKANANSNSQNDKNDEEEDRKQREKSWRMMKYSFAAFGVSIGICGSILIYELSRPNYDENGNIIEDEFTNLPYFQQLWQRFCREYIYYKKLIQEPSRDKLLPDPLKPPYVQPPYTLVLELTDVLVHPDWTYQTGWRFKKRPGVDQFLEAVTYPLFEIVVYTAEQGMMVWPILDALDPKTHIMYRLVRDSTRFIDGHHVKDLDAINRDLKKVIVVDWNESNVKLHPENLFKIPRWNGNDDDTTLFDLAAFLKTIASTEIGDVREVLTYYRQFDNPIEAFKENQRKFLQQIEEDETHKTQRDREKSLVLKWSPSFLRSH